MNTKKMRSFAILLAILVVAYAVATVAFCYTTKPAVKEGEFPFSITYEYKGETKTFSGIYKCEFSGSRTIETDHARFWDGEAIYDNPINAEYPNIIDENEELMTTLAIQENMYAGYFMGDPMHSDYYTSQGGGGPEPYIEYFDYKNDIYLDEENKDEILEAIDFRIIDFTYPEPIENSFYFSGVRYEADNVGIFALITFVFLILCIIFVRKDKDYKYSVLDKIGIVLNFLVGIFTLPFITFICILFGIAESSIEFINQFTYTVPSIAITGLALSVVFRRRGYRKTGFFIQFAGIAAFIIALLLDSNLS